MSATEFENADKILAGQHFGKDIMERLKKDPDCVELLCMEEKNKNSPNLLELHERIDIIQRCVEEHEKDKKKLRKKLTTLQRYKLEAKQREEERVRAEQERMEILEREIARLQEKKDHEQTRQQVQNLQRKQLLLLEEKRKREEAGRNNGGCTVQ